MPLYLLDAVGLQNKTPDAFSEAIEEGSDVPAKVLDETLQLYSKHEVKLLAYNAQTTGPETEKVLTAAKQNGIPVVPVTETLPSGKDYVGWMSANLDRGRRRARAVSRRPAPGTGSSRLRVPRRSGRVSISRSSAAS